MAPNSRKRVPNYQFLPDTDGDRPAAASSQRWNGREVPFRPEAASANGQLQPADQDGRFVSNALMDCYNG